MNWVCYAAGGLYTGEVVVWDTSGTRDPVLVQTGMSADGHREPVYHVRPSASPSHDSAHLEGNVVLILTGLTLTE